jgi:hypothetical protein
MVFLNKTSEHDSNDLSAVMLLLYNVELVGSHEIDYDLAVATYPILSVR